MTFNAFFFADDMLAALREARRVAKPGVPRHPGPPPDPDLSQPGLLRDLAVAAGLEPDDEFDATWTLEYPDVATLERAMVAVAGLAEIVGPEREPELKLAIGDGLARFRRRDGSYALSNEFHYLIA